jgi:transposase-like protein
VGGISTDESDAETTNAGGSSVTALAVAPAADPGSNQTVPSSELARSAGQTRTGKQTVVKPCPCGRGTLVGRQQKCEECKLDGPLCTWRHCFHCLEKKPGRAFPWGDGKKGRGVSRRRSAVCQACHDKEEAEREERAQARRATWEEDGVVVRRCARCKDVKPLAEGFYGEERYYCKTCDKNWVTYRKGVMTEEARQRKRELDTAASRRWRARNREKVRASQKAYRERRKQDPVRHAQALEVGRIGYRLRKEKREGVHPDQVVPKSTQVRTQRNYKTIDSRALLAAIEAYLAAYVDIAEDGTHVTVLSEESLAKRLGLSERALYRWRKGSEARVGVAQAWFEGIDMYWWEVWSLPTAPAERGPAADVQRYIAQVEEHLRAAEVYGDGSPVSAL